MSKGGHRLAALLAIQRKKDFRGTTMITTTMLHLLVAFDRMLQRTKDEDGQTLAEYGLIMSVVTVAVVVTAGIAFRGAIVGAFSDATACLSGNC